jgi:hypothetical protein
METMSTALSEKIQALSPNGTRGVVLLKRDYEIMRDFIVSCFALASEIPFSVLMSKLESSELIEPNEHAIWYLLKVKLDLEARGIIKVKFIGFAPRIQMLRLNRRALRDSLEESSSRFKV